jgi:ParB-like chromosome segregation protein Spo0J
MRVKARYLYAKMVKRGEKMNMFEEARALAVTMNMRKFNQKEIAKSLGVSPSYVANKLRLLKLSEDIQERIIQGRLTERHARALLCLKNEKDRRSALDIICKEKLSVASTEALIDLYNAEGRDQSSLNDKNLKHLDVLLDRIAELISRSTQSQPIIRAQIDPKNNSAIISIHINYR